MLGHNAGVAEFFFFFFLDFSKEGGAVKLFAHLKSGVGVTAVC